MVGSDTLGGIGGLIGGIAVAAGAAGKGGKKEHKAALDVWKKLQVSDFDYRALSPPELQVLGEYLPEVYQAVVPENFQGVSDSATGRAGQVQSLAQMQQIAGEGLPLVDRLQAQKAAGAVTSAASASQTDALRRLAARGQLGSGDEIQAQLAGSQQGANLARDTANDLATQAALRRMQAIGQSAGQA